MLKKINYNGKDMSIFYAEKYSIDGFSGIKSLLALEYFKGTDKGLSVAGSRDSMQVLKFSQVAQKLGKDIAVFIPTGKDTEMITELKETNAIINRIPYGYKTVLNKRSRDFASESGFKHVQVGMMEEFAFDNISKIYKQAMKDVEFEYHNSIIFPVGSGTSLIGFCRFCQENNIKNRVVGVSCGMNVDKLIAEHKKDFPDVDLTIVNSEMKYSDKFKNDFDLNETYEGKMLPFAGHNDLLVTVDR